MDNECFLGIDIGTFEAKGVICSPDGSIIATAASPHKMHVPQPGWAEHDPEKDWWEGFMHVTTKMLAQCDVKPNDIACISLSAIGPCLLPVDPNGDPFGNAILYGVDTRATEEINELTRIIGEDRIIEFNGNALTSQSVGPKILWLRRNKPEIFNKTAKFISSTTFLVQRLTGRCVIDHYTAANFTPLYNAHTQQWDNSIFNAIVDIDRLPELGWTTEIAGKVNSEAARASGLAEGTPVTVGTIDAAAEAISVGVISPGDLMVMYGSTMFFVMVGSNWQPHAKLWYAPWLFPQEHASLAGLATSGTLTHWFRDIFTEGLDRAEAFSVLLEEANASSKGANGLIVLPYFSGERTPIHDPDAKGCIFGLNLTHTRGDIYRAMLEGIAYGANHVFETFVEAGAIPERLLAVGGGTRNNLWTQAVSDISGFNQIIREITLGASYGNAFLAAIAVGAVERNDIDQWNKMSHTIDAESETAYVTGYQVFRQLYENTQGLMKIL